MRRTTLGTLNIGNQSRQIVREKKTSLGARSSVGSRLSTGRPSLARSATGRRPSSQYGRDNCVQIKDPRPLSDRGYQQRMIRYLMEFLTEFNYPHQVSTRILSAPSMKEFGSIFQFLYKYIRPDNQSASVTLSKLSEEVPKVFKMLGYPFTISKSNLSSVGSPHAWPIMLGALCWLIELIRHAVSIGQDIEGLVLFPEDAYGDDYQEEDPQQEDKYFFGYLEKSYSAFMHGQELDELGEFDREFIDNIRSRNAALLEGMDNLMSENGALQQELIALQNDSSQLQALSEQKVTLGSDREKFVSYITDLGRHRNQLQEVNIQLVEELKGLKMEQEALIQENAILQNTLNNQELSAADVERMKHEKRELQKAVEQLEKERDYFDQQIWEKEMQYAKRHEETEKHIREYNEMARKLKLIPPSAENAAGVDFEMHYNPHSQRPDQRARMDFRGTIKPALLHLKHEISENIRTIQSQNITEEEAFDQLSDMVTDKQEEVEALEAKIQASDKDLEWKKEMMTKEYQKSTGDAQSLDDRVHHMKMKLLEYQEAVEEKENKLKELKLRTEIVVTEREQEKEEYCDFVLKACLKIMEHKTVIQNRVAQLHEQAEDILQQTTQLEIPEATISLTEGIKE